MTNRCGDCDFLNRRDTKWKGEKVWCTWRQEYVKPGDCACKKYTYKGRNYGRYLVDATIEILNEDEALRAKFDEFREVYLENNTPSFLEDYDRYGYSLGELIKNDPENEYVADFMLRHAIEPTFEEVQKGNFEEAFIIYSDAFYHLLGNYEDQLSPAKEHVRSKKIVK